MMNIDRAAPAFGLAIALTCAVWAQPAAVASSATQPSPDITVQSVKIHGSLDLDNGVPIRWKKPDGSGYVNIFLLDKNGTLQLCHDPFYFEQDKPDRSVKPKDPQEREQRQKLEEQHQSLRVIEVRNPNSAYPDLRLPITRSRP